MVRTTLKLCYIVFFSSALRAGLSIALLLAGLLGAASQAVAAERPAVEAVTYDGPKVTPHEFIGDVRHLPPALPAQAPAELPYRPLLRPPVQPKMPPTAAPTEEAAAAISGPLAPMPSPAQNFAGMSRTDTCTGGQCGGGIPPDPNGDVGPNHYIQAVNDAYAIYSKTGTLLASFTENQLWAGAGAPVQRQFAGRSGRALRCARGPLDPDPLRVRRQRWQRGTVLPMHRSLEDQRSGGGRLVALCAAHGSRWGWASLPPARSTTTPSSASGTTASTWPPTDTASPRRYVCGDAVRLVQPRRLV